jgi:hypothetical protein
MEDVARQDAGEQNGNLGHKNNRRRDLYERLEGSVDPGRPVTPRAGRQLKGIWVQVRRVGHGSAQAAADGLVEDCPGVVAEFALPLVIEPCLTKGLPERSGFSRVERHALGG